MNTIDDDGWLQPIVNVSDIAPGLLMGSWPERMTQWPDVIVNCALRRHRPLIEGRIVINFAFADEPRLPDVAAMHAVADTINLYRARGMSVLVHCEAGLNRSGLIVALALVRAGMKGTDALATIRARRHADCLCNDTFAAYIAALS
jgi:protein-tyrosine phosphatase